MSKNFRQFLLYFGVGGTAAIVEWGSYSIFIYLVDVNYLFAVVLSFILSTAVNYYLSVRFVFKGSKFKFHSEAMLIYLVSGLGLVGNILLMKLFVGNLVINPIVSKIMATGIVFFWNYGARKIWIFRH